MNEKRLILNADDFGINFETNEAIEELFERGFVTSTTVMAPCRFAEDAVARAKRNGKIKMGLHLTFNSDRFATCGPLAKNVPSLTDKDGNFYESVAEFARHAAAREVAAEIYAQYEFVTRRGVALTHADNHMGSLYGLTGVSFMKEVLDFCAPNGLPFRFPKNIEGAKSIMRTDTIPPALAAAHAQAVEYAGARSVNLIDNLLTNPVPVADVASYHMLKNIYMDIVRNLRSGVNEIFMHPSKSGLAPVRRWEYELLADNELRELIESEGIRLVSWAEAFD
ncbi:MAG: ChbG/HpnK family deacetylase [Clostridiales bacterium]|jgi:predicted glycoside hydrolase/deacetylase ChbG (UPF0249 family)|nr:ChbG/HpnK family deacetylase [Clostridiales bacterium]